MQIKAKLAPGHILGHFLAQQVYINGSVGHQVSAFDPVSTLLYTTVDIQLHRLARLATSLYLIIKGIALDMYYFFSIPLTDTYYNKLAI